MSVVAVGGEGTVAAPAGGARWPLRLGLALLDRGRIPDRLVRRAIRRLCAERLASERAGGPAAIEARKQALRERAGAGPVAVATREANAQHYELPAAFFVRVLGPCLKYSGSYWPDGTSTLAAAEEAMLALYVERAELADGQAVLDLGCGWGSLTLWAASRFPSSRFLAISNSASQHAFIEAEAARRGLTNVTVLTRDVNDLVAGAEPPLGRRFDRIVSVEMLEHVRDHTRVLARLAAWMTPTARLFTHVFCHREVAYPFEVAARAEEDHTDWMARHFFTGGIMPSADLLPRCVASGGGTAPLVLDQQWLLDGTHYQRTADAWLANLDRERDEVVAVFEQVYGRRAARRWLARWRVFFMACAELFGYADGGEWMVVHHRFRVPEKARG
ncbi:MAG TPA: class I SAM-dependent methyltransferase [Thermoanaerobaculia bacterium]|nr:class I SAM-dependent methyltransferase [Thermoanaerobaculia bacterium]